MNTQIIEFLTNNPNSNKGQIADGVNLRGLALFNFLKGMVKSGEIQVEGEGHDATYSIPASQESSAPADANEVEVVKKEEALAQVEIETPAAQPTPAKKQVGRNAGTYLFNGVSYNKGKLIQAVVAAHVAKNNKITHDKLKEVFPDTLLKRFGIFQTVEKAREISGAKYDRYFFKDEFQIKLKDAVIVTCNQITGENILPFLDVCAKLGYEIVDE